MISSNLSGTMLAQPDANGSVANGRPVENDLLALSPSDSINKYGFALSRNPSDYRVVGTGDAAGSLFSPNAPGHNLGNTTPGLTVYVDTTSGHFMPGDLLAQQPWWNAAAASGLASPVGVDQNGNVAWSNATAKAPLVLSVSASAPRQVFPDSATAFAAVQAAIGTAANNTFNGTTGYGGVVAPGIGQVYLCTDGSFTDDSGAGYAASMIRAAMVAAGLGNVAQHIDTPTVVAPSTPPSKPASTPSSIPIVPITGPVLVDLQTGKSTPFLSNSGAQIEPGLLVDYAAPVAGVPTGIAPGTGGASLPSGPSTAAAPGPTGSASPGTTSIMATFSKMPLSAKIALGILAALLIIKVLKK